VPALFVETPDAVNELLALNWNDDAQASSALTAVFGTNLQWLGELVAVRVPPTLPHACPGDGITVAGNTGLLGSAVRWAGGHGFLTAGHVAQAMGNAVFDSVGSNLGNVVFVRTGSSAVSGGCTSSSVDVAVIRLRAGIPVQTAGITGTGTASPRASVHVYTALGPRPHPALIYAATQWWWMSGLGVALTQVYLSGSGVTNPGDSGGPVTLSAYPNLVVGHVVGGNAVLSCFQEVDHQLAEIRGDPTFSTITI
jgi:hypothetical protein